MTLTQLLAKHWWRIALVLSLATLAAKCEKDKARPPAYGTVRMDVGSRTFTLEVAATEKAQQLGLMHRKSMPADHGMIFVFADEQPRRFWMRNTLIPLDILYLDAKGKIVSIKPMKPLDETGVESDEPAKYAIELNEGTAKAVGVKPGDTLSIPPAAREPAE